MPRGPVGYFVGFLLTQWWSSKRVLVMRAQKGLRLQNAIWTRESENASPLCSRPEYFSQ